MALEDKNAQHYGEVVDKYIDPQVNTWMTTRDYVVRPSANEISGPIHVFLPPVADAKGRIYSIIARDADVVNNITVHDRSDSECWLGDIVLNNKCDRLLAYSDGLAWFPGFGGGNWPGLETTIPPGTVCPTTHEPQ